MPSLQSWEGRNCNLSCALRKWGRKGHVQPKPKFLCLWGHTCLINNNIHHFPGFKHPPGSLKIKENGLKLCQSILRLDKKNNFITGRATKQWNSLPREVLERPSLQFSKFFFNILNPESSWNVPKMSRRGHLVTQFSGNGGICSKDDPGGLFQP